MDIIKLSNSVKTINITTENTDMDNTNTNTNTNTSNTRRHMKTEVNVILNSSREAINNEWYAMEDAVKEWFKEVDALIERMDKDHEELLIEFNNMEQERDGLKVRLWSMQDVQKNTHNDLVREELKVSGQRMEIQDFVDALAKAVRERDEHVATVKVLKEELDKVEFEVATKECEGLDMQQDYDALKMECESLQFDNESLKTDNESFVQEIKDLEQQLSAATDERMDVEDYVEEIEDLKGQLADAISEKEDLESEKEDLENEKEELEEERDEAMRERDEAQEERDDLSTENEALKQALSELQGMQSHMAELMHLREMNRKRRIIDLAMETYLASMTRENELLLYSPEFNVSAVNNNEQVK